MGRRRQGREIALQALYLSDTAHMSVAEAVIIVTAGGPIDEKTLEFARSLAQGTSSNLSGLDIQIQEVAKNWTLERMASVDRNLLRLASFELLFHPATPVRVVIDEAIEIAKAFSSAESSKFINGILDKVKDLRPKEETTP